jgi:cell division cycle 14
LRGLEKAIQLGWYNFSTFDYKEYEYNHRLENGDMNWIIPKKLLALSSPTDRASDGLPPQHFVDKFLKKNIKAVIRLNESLYSEEVFE